MATFLTGNELTDAIYDIIWKASEKLVIVSPFIKLDDYFKDLFNHHMHNHKLRITIIFGKNEGSPQKSLCNEDFEFFKQFKNIGIIYCKNLHAKYYANENDGILTSINLYDASFKNNIEYGVFYNGSVLNSLANGADKAAMEYTYKIALTSPAIFVKRPIYDKSILGTLIGQKSFVESEVLHDQTELMLRSWYNWEKEPQKFIQDFPGEKIAIDKNSKRPERILATKEDKPKKEYSSYNSYNENSSTGFCIRTGISIPFNPRRPMCEDAYRTWSQFKNMDYPEKYCHKSGRKSYGQTSIRNPILNS